MKLSPIIDKLTPPPRFEEAIQAVRLSGKTNMFDHPVVTILAAEMGYPEVAAWLAVNRKAYSCFLLSGGTRPLIEKEDA